MAFVTIRVSQKISGNQGDFGLRGETSIAWFGVPTICENQKKPVLELPDYCTWAKVHASLKNCNKMSKRQETDRQSQETNRQSQEANRQSQETDRQSQETNRQSQETNRQIFVKLAAYS